MALKSIIANSLWLASAFPSFLNFRRRLAAPQRTQHHNLLHCLSRNKKTVYGRRYAFSEIASYHDFARNVPLVNYDDLEPWINRIKRGEQHVLTRASVTHLIPTSGSTGAGKLIPFTSDLQHQFNQAIGPWIFDLFRDCPALVRGKAYWSITPAVANAQTQSSAVPIGFEEDSSYLGARQKEIVSALMAVPSELRLISDMNVFRYMTLLCLLRQRDLRLISIWHPSFLTLLLDALSTQWDDLLQDIRQGRCKYEQHLLPRVLESLTLTPQPQRAHELAQCNLENPKTIWPDLKVISCWGDGHAAGALRELQKRFPGVRIQPKGLLATEAFVTFPFNGYRPLAICSHFFEFLDDHGHISLAHELQQGREYELIVTTGGGLYRYRLGDRVRVDGFLLQTPSLTFLGRNGNISDRFGEKLSEAFVARAVQEVTSLLPELPRFALLAPEEFPDGIAYTLFIEGPVDDELDLRLDQALAQNHHYFYCRELGQLQPPKVFRVPARGYENYINRELSQGKRLGDIKPASLSPLTGWSKHFLSDHEDLKPN